METLSILGIFLILFISLMQAPTAFAQHLKTIELPKPRTEGGKPLMDAIRERSTSREFSSRELSLQVLSNLLWAAFGINRPDSGKRTAPSARNWQEIDIYIATQDGLFLYDPRAHALHQVLFEDIRTMTGKQPFVTDVPVNLVYVADLSRMGDASPPDKDLYSAVDAGFISQNVYLFCSSEGLSTVVRGLIDRPALAGAMKLRPDQRIIVAQSVGYPGK